MNDRLRELYCKSESHLLSEKKHRVDLKGSCSLATLDHIFGGKSRVTHLCLLKGCLIEGDWRVFFAAVVRRACHLDTVTVTNDADTRYIEPLLDAIVDHLSPPKLLTLVLLLRKPLCADSTLIDTLVRAPLKYNLLLTACTEEDAGAVVGKLRTRVTTLFAATYERHAPVPMTLQLTNTDSVAFAAAQKDMALCPALPECVRHLWIDGSPAYAGHCMDRQRHLETLDLLHAARLPCTCIMHSITTLCLVECSIRSLLLPAQLQELSIVDPRYKVDLIGQPVALRQIQIKGAACLVQASIDWSNVTHLSLGCLDRLDSLDFIEWENLWNLENLCIEDISPDLFSKVCDCLKKIDSHGHLKQLKLGHDGWQFVGMYELHELPLSLLANVTDLSLCESFDLPVGWLPTPGARVHLRWKQQRVSLVHLAMRTDACVSCTAMEQGLLVLRIRDCKRRLLDLLALARARDGVVIGTQAIESILAMMQKSLYPVIH